MLINMILPRTVEVVPPDENTLLLLHGEDLTDGSIYRQPVSNSGVTVSTAQSKFGGKSLYFNGSSAKLVIPYSNMFDFGTGDFTIDAWLYPQTISTEQSLFSCAATGGLFFSIRDASRIGIGRVLEAWDTTITASLTANTWNHVAVVRSNSTVMLFINGVLKGSGTNTTSYSMGGNSIQIGAEINACYYKGYIDEFRVSNVARWIETFTPPNEPYDPSGSGGNSGNGGNVGGDFSFTYSGNYTDNRINGKGTVRLNTSGVLTTSGESVTISAYIQGAGGGAAVGGLGAARIRGATGGGGGNQAVTVTLTPGAYEVVIGNGGTSIYDRDANSFVGGDGGDTIAFNYTSKGGGGAEFALTESVVGSGGIPNGNSGNIISDESYTNSTHSGGSPNGGGYSNATVTNGGDGYVELTFI